MMPREGLPLVLVVDDQETARFFAAEAMRQAGFAVVEASSGAEALETVERERPDLILLDVVMPKMDGFEACRRLREQEATREIPVIMVTTRGEAQNVEQGYALGCNDYVTKPINSLELMTKVNNLLNGSAGA